MLHLLQAMQSSPADGPGKVTDLREFLHSALQFITRRSLVFVVSDFISEPGLGQAAGLPGAAHEVLAVRLYDPLEMALPDIWAC